MVNSLNKILSKVISNMNLEDIANLKVLTPIENYTREDDLIFILNTINFRGNRSSLEISKQLGTIVLNNEVYINDFNLKKQIIDQYFKNIISSKTHDFYKKLGVDYI